MKELILAWCLISAFFIIFELSWPGLFLFLSLSCGAFAAALTAALTMELAEQLTTFTAITFGSYLALKFWVERTAKDGSYKTNIYALVGKQGVVKDKVSSHTKGWVIVGGELWSAYGSDDLELDGRRNSCYSGCYQWVSSAY
jgi:membrane protein implicated in regulation of membrane protease activity